MTDKTHNKEEDRMWHLHHLWVVLLLTLLFCGCKHKNLCYDHHNGVPTRIYVDWKNAPTPPTGMTVIAYPYVGGTHYTKQTNNSSYAEMHLGYGDYRFLAFNQIPSEFETVRFDYLESYYQAIAHTRERTNTWYNRSENERVVHNVEWLGTGVLEDVDISSLELMADSRQRNNDTRYTKAGDITPEPRVVNIKVTVYVKGIQNLRSIRGSIGGLAEGCLLSSGIPTDDKVTHLLEKWEAKVYENDKTKGELVCHITSFGLPVNHQDIAEENKLGLSILLQDNKTIKDYVFNVGKRFEFSTELGLELELKIGTNEDDGPIELPNVTPEGGSGFDVNVDDWEDVENIEIPM